MQASPRNSGNWVDGVYGGSLWGSDDVAESPKGTLASPQMLPSSPKMLRMPSLSEEDAVLSRTSTCTPTGGSMSPSRSRGPLSPSMRFRRSSSILSSCTVMSSKSWFEDGVAVEDVAPPDKSLVEASLAEKSVVFADIKPHSKEVQNDPAMAALLEQVRILSDDCFNDNCLEGCSKRGGWRITLLASRLDEGPGALLLAFIVFRLKPDQQCLSISKLAVPETQRRRGYGQQMVAWCVQYVKTLNDFNSVCLASLVEAVKFYQALGFKKILDLTSKDDDECTPGQVYMELRIKKGGKKGGGGTAKSQRARRK